MPLVLMVFLLALVLPAQGSGVEDFERQQIIERIQPIGKVRIEGKSVQSGAITTQTPPLEQQPTVKKEPGQLVYESHCVVCHGDGVAGAPRFRNTTDWAPRLAKVSGVDELKSIAIKGLNIMPPKGTCAECSDDDIKEAIQYMLPRK